MAQLERSILATPAADHRAPRIGRGALVTLAVIALAGAVVTAALVVPQGIGDPDADAGTRAEVVDGWMPAISAANRAAGEAAMLERAGMAQDGWSAALLKPESMVTDGWAGRYLVNDE